MSLHNTEEWLKGRLLMRLMRHVEALCDPRVTRRGVEMQVEVEVEVVEEMGNFMEAMVLVTRRVDDK